MSSETKKPFEIRRDFARRHNPHFLHVRWLMSGLNVHLPDLPPDAVGKDGGAAFQLDGPCIGRWTEIHGIKHDLFRRFEQPESGRSWPRRSERLDCDEDRLAAIGVLEERHDEGQVWWHVPDEFPAVIAFLEERLPEWAHHKKNGEPCRCGWRGDRPKGHKGSKP